MKHEAKHIVAIVCAGILGILSALGEQIAEPQARAIALRRFGALGIPNTRGAHGSTIRLAYQQNAPTGQTDFYVYTPEGGQGFVIIAGDDCLPQVLGYSDVNRFAKDSIPPQLKAIFRCYGEYIKASSGRLVGAGTPKTRSGAAVRPLLGDIEWDQNEPFNQFTPVIKGKHSPTGCVATAVAQIMRYHSWPPEGKGSGKYSIDSEKGKDVTVSIAGHTYSWAAMRNSYPDLSNASANQAVGRLLFDVGVAVEMSYGEDESAAYSSNAARALIENFQYSNALRLMYRQNHSSEEWEKTIQDELQAKRPVYYAGGSPRGGHAFVCDGYDGKGLYHINWGWSGYSNGYFSLIEMLPGYQGTGAGGGGGYISGQDIIVGIQPNNLSATPQPLIYAETFKITEGNSPAADGVIALLKAYNYSGEPLSGKVGVLLCDQTGKTVAQYTARQGSDGMMLLYGPKDGNVMLDGLNSLAPGDYRAYPAFFMTDKNEWVNVRVPLNMPQFFTLTIDNSSNTVTVRQDDSHKVNLVAQVNTTELHSAQNAISITYTNHGQRAYTGLIGFRLVHDGNLQTFTNAGKNVYYTNSFIEPGQSVTYETLIGTPTAYDATMNAVKFLQVLYDATNGAYDPKDDLRSIPHHVLSSVPVSVDSKRLVPVLSQIVTDVPTEHPRGNKLTVEVKVKLKDPAGYYAGCIALQFIQEKEGSLWIKGQVGRKQYITLKADEETTLTFTGLVTVKEGEYTLSVGYQGFDSKQKKLWNTAIPFSKDSDVQRFIRVTKSKVTTPTTTLPVVIDLNDMQETAVESPKLIPLKVHPNPAVTQIHIEASDGQPIQSVALYTLAGQCVKRVESGVSAHQITISVSQLPAGLYILRVIGTEKGLHGEAKVLVGGKL